MTVQEGKQMIEELKAQGATEEEIVSGFYGLFVEDEIDINELGDLVQLVGYELSDEFKNMSPEDQKTKGWAEDEVDEDIKDGENPTNDGDEGRKDDGEDDKPNPNPNPNNNGKDEPKDDNEEDERAKAKKLFGLN